MAQLLWRPSGEQIADANITRFREWIGLNAGASIPDYPALYRWSIDHAPDFWQAVWEFCGVIAQRRGDEVVRDFDKMPGARWFPDARLSFAANLLRYNDDREALVSWNENGRQRVLTYSELNHRFERDGRPNRRSSRGLHAQPARDGHRDARRDEPRRCLVFVFS